MHNEPCKCGNTRPWLTIEGRTDDILCFENGVRIAPMLFYAILKEVHGINRFQLVQHNDDRLELRLIADNKQEIFNSAKKQLRIIFLKMVFRQRFIFLIKHLRHTLSAESISILLQKVKFESGEAPKSKNVWHLQASACKCQTFLCYNYRQGYIYYCFP